MSKYEPFEQWFKKQPLSTTEVVLTFARIEGIIGNTLPSGAREKFTSWANFHASLQDSWLTAGWRTVMVDFENERVKFKRTSTLTQPKVSSFRGSLRFDTKAHLFAGLT